MSGLDVASGVLALLQLSFQVAQSCAQYYQDVAHAKSDVTRIQSQMLFLQDVLVEVDKILKGGHETKLTASHKVGQSVSDCLSQLTTMEAKLKIGKGRKAMKRIGLRALSWPFTRHEIDQIIRELETGRATIQLALQVDTAATVQKIDLSLDLSKLPSAEDAAFDSRCNQLEATCHPYTRVDLLRDIDSWAHDPDGKSMYWLSGMAGTGKSTIAYTAARNFMSSGQLGASFFFKRGEGDRGNAKRFFTTISSQLAHSRPSLIPAIRMSIDSTPNISEKSYADQFDRLVLTPLKNVKIEAGSMHTIVIVVDALDECESEGDIKIILRLLAQAQTIQGVRLRVFVTSRPDLSIRLSFRDMAQHVYHSSHLHEIAKDIIDHDLHEFLSDELKKIGQDRSLPVDWPGSLNRHTLVKTASPLFIFAATICRFIGDRRWDPEEQLQIVLKYSTQSQTSRLYQTYSPVFDRLLTDCTAKESKILVEEFQKIIGSVVTFEEPLTVTSMSKLLDVSSAAIDRRLENFHSVMDIANGHDTPVRVLHLSFRDFLFNPQDQGPDEQAKFKFWINQRQAHTFLARQCLNLLSRPGILRRDVCNLGFPGSLQKDIDGVIIRQHLPLEVQYACRYWISHLKSGGTDELFHQAYIFLKTKLLYWIEALSLIGRLLDALHAIELLNKLTLGRNERLGAFLEDAKRFILACRPAIEVAPLQTYCTGLLFAPERSIVKEAFQKESPSWVMHGTRVQPDWNRNHTTFQGHSDCIRSVAFSPDGKRIASGSDDMTVMVWDTGSGAELTRLKGHTHTVRSVVFSPDSKWVASGSHDTTIRLFDVEAHVLLAVLEDHSDPVTSVAFGPNGKFLASGSIDRSVKLWDPKSCSVLFTLKHTDLILSVAISPNGKQGASGSRDGLIKIWDTDSGKTLTVLRGHDSKINSIRFLSDGKRIASGSSDRTIKVWNIETGVEPLVFEGHKASVWSAVPSPDGKLIASASSDSTVRLWDRESGTLLALLKGHSLSVNTVAYSPDGKFVASGSNDHTLKLWDAETSVALALNNKRDESIWSIALSPDGRRLASGSGDRTVIVCDAGSDLITTTIPGQKGSDFASAYPPDGKRRALESNDHTIRIWDVKTGVIQTTLRGHRSSVSALAFSPNGKHMASGSCDHTIRLWDTEIGMILSTLRGHESLINAIAFSPEDKYMASGSGDCTVRVWDYKLGATMATFEGHGSSVNAVAFSPDGNYLASGSNDLTVRLWDFKRGVSLAILSGHSRSVDAVVFSPDGKFVISGSYDSTIRLWDAESGDMLVTQNIATPVQELSFSTDGCQLNTDRGPLQLRSDDTPTHHFQQSGFFVTDEWLMWKSQKFLWLPMEYRATSVAVGEQTVFLGHRSGLISFLVMDTSKMDTLGDGRDCPLSHTPPIT